MLKNVQLEFNFENNRQEESQQEVPLDNNTTRGSKRFIEQMREELEEITPQQMFEDEKDEQE